jgi:hypothetical protein
VLILIHGHSGMGHANERIARLQETFIQNATSSWLESLERSLAQMKEYQVRLLSSDKRGNRIDLMSPPGRPKEARATPPCL